MTGRTARPVQQLRGSWLGLMLVLVLRCNVIAHTVLHVSRGPFR